MKKKGKILKVKRGYNSNSGSIGSVIFAFPTAIFGITAGFGIISGIIMSKFIKQDTVEEAEES